MKPSQESIRPAAIRSQISETLLKANGLPGDRETRSSFRNCKRFAISTKDKK